MAETALDSDAFGKLARRLELTLVRPELARGRWRGRAVSLDATGWLRVSLTSGELVHLAEESQLPLLPIDGSLGLAVRSPAPGRLATVLERPDLSSALFELLGRAQAVEISDAALGIQLEGLGELPTLKDALDHSVELAEKLGRALSLAPVRKIAPAAVQTDECDPVRLEGYRAKVAQLRDAIRAPLATAVGFSAVIAFFFLAGLWEVALFLVIFPVVAGLLVVSELEDVACPSCEGYLSVLWRWRRCPRCGLNLE